jgi:LAS superfamily LD-carboxypeptidase LdcB
MKKKITIALFIIISLLVIALSVASCGEGDNGSTNTSTTEVYDSTVTLTSSKSEISVGEKITIKIELSGVPNVKSAGFIVNYDEELFEFVSGDFSVNGEVADFKDGTGVIAFDEATNINKTVATFTLKALKTATNEEISVKASLLDSTDKKIDVEVEPFVVTVK